MIKNNKEKFIIISSIFICIVIVFFWIFYNPVKDFTINIPGMDNKPDSISSFVEDVKIGEKFVQLIENNSELTGKWTRFRGGDFDNIVKDKTKLIDKFGNAGAKILWSVKLGEGHSAPAIYNGKVYILDYKEEEKEDALRCFDFVTGNELWQRNYSVHVKRNHGMSRTMPAVTDSFIVTIGPKGHVMCANPNNGDFIWGVDLIRDYEAQIPFWYTGQCPMIDSNTAVIAPAGTSLLIGIDCASGKVVWETPNPDKWTMSHSSIMQMEFEGKKMYVYAAVGGMCGVSAEGDDIGKILWTTKEFSPTVVAPSPVVFDDGRIFMTAGYGAGAIMFQLKRENEKYSVSVLQEYKPKDGMACEQQTPIVFDGHMFAILPKDAGSLRNQFVCCKPDDCKNILWTSGKANRFGLGPYVLADGKFFILNDDGTLTIAKATSSKFVLLDKLRIIEGHDAWAPLAIADGKLLMRDYRTMVCVDIKHN